MATSSRFSRSLDCWRVVAAPERELSEGALAELPGWAVRLSEFVGPALAAQLTAPATAALGRPPIDPAQAKRARALNRYTRAAQEACLKQIAGAGIPCVAIKGYALARQVYPDPDLRTTGDLDLVIQPADRDALIALLSDTGYVFRPEPAKPWGSIADASYAPFMSADGGVNLDIHVQPDSYPLHLGLDRDALFATAEPGGGCMLPAPSHSFLLLASNAAKDKFAPLAMKKFVDALVMLRLTPDLDWREIETRAGKARLSRPLAAFLGLLAALGGEIPERYARSGPPGGELLRALRPIAELDAGASLGLGGLLRREILLSAEPRVAIHNLGLRLTGLARPRSNVPLD